MIAREIDLKIHLLLIEYEVMKRGEILNHFPESKHRTVNRALKKLVEKNDIDYGKIRGKGKLKRFSLTEENTKNNLLLEIVEGNKKKWKHVKVPVTQKNLSELITQEIQFYRNDELNTLKKIKDPKSLHNYISYNIAIIIKCLKWISQLTWAINSGMLGNSKTKLALAKRNKARYEEFLSKVVYNLTTRSEQNYKRMMKAISKLIYNEIMDSMIFEESTIGTKKGKLFYQFNKKSKYYF